MDEILRDLGNLRIKEKLFKSSGIGRIKHVKTCAKPNGLLPYSISFSFRRKKLNFIWALWRCTSPWQLNVTKRKATIRTNASCVLPVYNW